MKSRLLWSTASLFFPLALKWQLFSLSFDSHTTSRQNTENKKNYVFFPLIIVWTCLHKIFPDASLISLYSSLYSHMHTPLSEPANNKIKIPANTILQFLKCCCLFFFSTISSIDKRYKILDINHFYSVYYFRFFLCTVCYLLFVCQVIQLFSPPVAGTADVWSIHLAAYIWRRYVILHTQKFV